MKTSANKGNTNEIIRVSSAALLTGLLATSGCTWVDPMPGASRVTLVMPQHVSQCQPLGSTTSQVKAQVGPVHRSESKVQEELLTLAQELRGRNRRRYAGRRGPAQQWHPALSDLQVPAGAGRLKPLQPRVFRHPVDHQIE